jgi:hypothetical protein
VPASLTADPASHSVGLGLGVGVGVSSLSSRSIGLYDSLGWGWSRVRG